MKRYVPNIITISSPFVAILIYRLIEVGVDFGNADVILGAFALAVGNELGDLLDGWLARRWEVTSELGKLADPLSDQCQRWIILLPLVELTWAPVWAAQILIIREFIGGFIRNVLSKQGVLMGARLSGKIKTWGQGFASCAAIGFNGFYMKGWCTRETATTAILTFFGIAAIIAVVSGVDYAWHGYRQWRRLERARVTT